MNINKLAAKNNLLLDWRRITASRDARYKNFFRPILEAYELSADKNISDLGGWLRRGEFTPRSPVRIYMPKPSGLQRPLTLLHIEDQIVLQALAVCRRAIRLPNLNLFFELKWDVSPDFLPKSGSKWGVFVEKALSPTRVPRHLTVVSAKGTINWSSKPVKVCVWAWISRFQPRNGSNLVKCSP